MRLPPGWRSKLRFMPISASRGTTAAAVPMKMRRLSRYAGLLPFHTRSLTCLLAAAGAERALWGMRPPT